MHRALLIQEIRDHIFASIKKDRRTGRCTLATLARTCSILSEASLDALWSELDSLRPLASCIYVANMMSSSDEPTAEINNIMEPDFSVLYKYAHRVSRLDLSGQQRFSRLNTGHPSVTDDLGALLYFAMRSPLLPNLKHLVWVPGMSLNLLRHLLNPHLLSLKIPNHRWGTESTLFSLNRIPGLCPKIKSLTLQVRSLDLYPEPRSTQSCISRVICCWNELEELDCNPTTREGVLRLSALSSLKILRLQVNSLSVLDLPSDSLSFPLLHTLQFQSDTLETAITLMSAIQSSPRSVTIDVLAGRSRRGSYSPETIGVLLRLLDRDRSHHELEEFSLNFPFVLGDDPIDVCDMLRPLFPYCELRTLCIRMTLPFILGDKDLRKMAAAWPRLEKLELIDSRPRVLIPSAQPLLSLGLGQPNEAPPPTLSAGSVEAAQLQLSPPSLATAHVNPQPISVVPVPVTNYAFPPQHQCFPVTSRTADITFHGLISLLELCPNLYYFDLAIDATKLDGLQDHKPGGGVCNRLIKCARLIDSPVGDPEVVARVLLDILPRLDSFAGPKALIPTHPHNMAPEGWLAVRLIMLSSRNTTRERGLGSVHHD